MARKPATETIEQAAAEAGSAAGEQSSSAATPTRTRLHILRPVGATDYTGARLVKATSKVAALLFASSYTAEIAGPDEVQGIYEAGGRVEIAP